MMMDLWNTAYTHPIYSIMPISPVERVRRSQKRPKTTLRAVLKHDPETKTTKPEEKRRTWWA